MNISLSDRYQIKSQLGEGGFSSVYRAYDHRLGRDVAVKILKRELAMTEGIVERFLREAKLTASLSHPNSLRIFDYGHSEGDLYIVSELLQGITLDEHLRAVGTVEEAWLIEHFIPLCLALQEAHDAGIIHRDLKPSNLFLQRIGAEERLVLIDFGISKSSLDQQSVKVTQTGQLFGTPQYMSPEQILTPRQVDLRSDLYSLGVIIFELFSGVAPFLDENMYTLLSQHLSQQAEPLHERAPHVSFEMSNLVADLLAKSVEDRPASAWAVAERMNALLVDQSYARISLSSSAIRSLQSVELMQTLEISERHDTHEVPDTGMLEIEQMSDIQADLHRGELSGVGGGEASQRGSLKKVFFLVGCFASFVVYWVFSLSISQDSPDSPDSQERGGPQLLQRDDLAARSTSSEESSETSSSSQGVSEMNEVPPPNQPSALTATQPLQSPSSSDPQELISSTELKATELREPYSSGASQEKGQAQAKRVKRRQPRRPSVQRQTRSAQRSKKTQGTRAQSAPKSGRRSRAEVKSKVAQGGRTDQSLPKSVADQGDLPQLNEGSLEVESLVESIPKVSLPDEVEAKKTQPAEMRSRASKPQLRVSPLAKPQADVAPPAQPSASPQPPRPPVGF